MTQERRGYTFHEEVVFEGLLEGREIRGECGRASSRPGAMTADAGEWAVQGSETVEELGRARELSLGGPWPNRTCVREERKRETRGARAPSPSSMTPGSGDFWMSCDRQRPHWQPFCPSLSPKQTRTYRLNSPNYDCWGVGSFAQESPWILCVQGLDPGWS